MIYVYAGNDINKKSSAKEVLLQSFTDREVFFINEDNFNPEQFQNFLSGGDLFSQKYVVIMDSLIASDIGEMVLDQAGVMASSESIFVILEPGLLKAPSEILKKHAKDFKHLLNTLREPATPLDHIKDMEYINDFLAKTATSEASTITT